MSAAAVRMPQTQVDAHIERSKLRGAMERLIDSVGFAGTLSAVEKARADYIAAHRDEAEREGWIG